MVLDMWGVKLKSYHLRFVNSVCFKLANKVIYALNLVSARFALKLKFNIIVVERTENRGPGEQGGYPLICRKHAEIAPILHHVGYQPPQGCRNVSESTIRPIFAGALRARAPVLQILIILGDDSKISQN